MLDKPTFPYGAGFRSLTTETPAPVALAVTGALPSWLKGTLLRTGPSKFEVGARTYNHWFDGLAMLHRFAIADGGVSYANRFLDSKAFRAAEETGKITYAEFATDPCRTLFGRVAAIFDPKLTDNCCVNVSAYAREVTAFTETTMPLRFAPDTLETLGVFGYGEALKGQISTAHPHYDAKRACHYNYIADLGMKSVYRLCRIGDDGTQFELAAIPVERPAYMHSFGMSADHLILTEFPLVVNPIDLRLSGKPFIQNYRWEAERGLVFHVVEKDTGRLVRTAKADASFAFHHVNAFADGDGLAVDVVAYPDADDHRSALPGAAARRHANHRHRQADPVSDSARERGARHAPDFGRPAVRAAPHQLRGPRRQSPTAMSGARASRPRAISSIASSRSTLPPAPAPAGTRRDSIRASRCSCPRLPPPPRTTGCCCRSCSTSTRAAPSCSCSTPRASRSWRGRRRRMPSPSISMAISSRASLAWLDLGTVLADIPAGIQGSSV